MSLIVANNGGAGFAPIEPGTYTAICYSMIDLGNQYSEMYDNWQHKVLIGFEIPSETYTSESGEESSRSISKRYTASLNEKASLRKDLASWRGRDFTDEELKGFNLANILGAPCMINIINRERNGRTYAEISGIMKLPKGMPVPFGRLEKISFDIDESPLAMIDTMPQWIQDTIRESKEYKARTGQAVADQDPAGELFDRIENDEVPF